MIYGRLQGAANGGQPVRLYHHLEGSGNGYTLVGTTKTDGRGFYEFTREEGVVYTNRNWFVRGPDGSHSRVVHERVEPLVSIRPSTASTDTSHRVVVSGAVSPSHAYERVFLQEQVGSSDDWRTLRSDTLSAGSRYLIAYRWRRPGTHDVRVLFRGDARNIRGASDPVTVNVEQAQIPGFTIASSQPIAPAGSSVTISGVLDRSGTSTPEPGAPVQLWVRGLDAWVPAPVAEELFIMVRECLRNAWTHAGAPQILVNIDIAPHEVQAEVIDPRTLRPLDLDTVIGSIRKTNPQQK